MIGDVGKMVAVGVAWGATNAFMRRGALRWDQSINSSPLPKQSHSHKFHHRLINSIRNWLSLLLFWHYSVPFFLNLCASATFFVILSGSPISLAVPVTNATTFAATAVFGMVLGEETRLGFALCGMACIVIGVWLCIS